MICRINKISIALFIFLFCNFFYVAAQERQDAREEAMQRSLEREGSYSQAPQQEPTLQLREVTPIITPSTVEFMQKVQKAQEKALIPGAQAQGGTPQKVTPIISPSVVEFMEKVQKEHEKALAPAPKSSQELLSFKEKLKKKEKAEKEKKEEKETELTTVVVEPQPALETEERKYYIDLGDILDISVWELPVSQEKLAERKTKEKKGEEYYIDLGDTLDISVWQVPDLSRSDVIVRPDGKISFPLIGDIRAEGLTLTQLDGIVTEKLKEYVKNPEVSIMVRGFGRSGAGVKGIGKIDEAVVRSVLSQSDVIVRPDGKISFPLIGDIRAEGLTLTQLDGIVTEKLKEYVKNPDVSIMIRRFGEQANKVVILGEILSPGVYKFGGPPTITEVIASAGGYTRYAVLNSVMIIRGDVINKPEGIRVNFAKILKGRLSENIFLKPNDIVYVPRSFIGNVNVFLEMLQPAISEYMQTMNARQFHNIMHRN